MPCCAPLSVPDSGVVDGDGDDIEAVLESVTRDVTVIVETVLLIAEVEDIEEVVVVVSDGFATSDGFGDSNMMLLEGTEGTPPESQEDDFEHLPVSLLHTSSSIKHPSH
jgi:hypothetical protein